MYLKKLSITNFRCFGEGKDRFQLSLSPGLTALVGENDAGKSAVIDAIRLALGTSDQEWNPISDSDFHLDGGSRAKQIQIVCEFSISPSEWHPFQEYLSYEDPPVFVLNWTASETGKMRRGRPVRRVDVHSGRDGAGKIIDAQVRELLRAVYLRPLRDADHALTAGRGSRLAQVLRHSTLLKTGEDLCDNDILLKDQELSILGIARLVDSLLEQQMGVVETRKLIDVHLNNLSLTGDDVTSTISTSSSTDADEVRLRDLLEKLDLQLNGRGKRSLGSNNLLFMACELLLVAGEDEGNRLLLIEEPEAHLHAQRQLRAMQFLQGQASKTKTQIIVTTHSPNLASAIDLNNIILIDRRHAFPFAQGQTRLEKSDYRFLQRFLDVTKANLFFARAVLIVEGDAENILLPTLGRLLDRSFTDFGVSIVNVGHTGLRRYARIFQRRDLDTDAADGQIGIRVACVADTDVMPNCAPEIIGKVESGKPWPATKDRRWRAKADFPGNEDLAEFRMSIDAKATGQCVRTFVCDEWTLEYALAIGQPDTAGTYNGGLAEDVYVSGCLALQDDAINSGKKRIEEVEKEAIVAFGAIVENAHEIAGCTVPEVIASHVYAKFVKKRASKAVAAQYLADRLINKYKNGLLTPETLSAKLPTYLLDAIRFVTSIQTSDG